MKIIGIGNALVDVLVKLEDDSVLETLKLERGGMTLINDTQHKDISKLMDSLCPSVATGGSAGNTILALARLNQHPGLIGKIGNDKMGRFFTENCKITGINALLLEGTEATGVANTFISKDSERTFATHLGAAATIKADDVQKSWFEGYELLYLEGYLVQNHQLIERIAQVAKEMGLLIAIDLASYNVVRENLEFLRQLVNNYIDIVFANQEESVAFTGETDPDKALENIASMTKVAVVKLGGEGSISMSDNQKFSTSTPKVDVVDTTAAGDFFAGGFLYAYGQHAPIEKCLKCGSLLAGNVIQVIGTRLPDTSWKQIIQDAQEILL